MRKILIACLLLITTINLNAQILSWDFVGNTGAEVSVVPGFANPDLAPSQIVRGNVNGVALVNSFNSNGWTTSNLLADAITNNSYYQFTIQANAGYTVSPAGISANFRRTSDGPSLFQWMYSLDGTNFTNIGSAITFNTANTNGNAQAPVDLSAITALDNVGNGTTITIRLYGYNAGSSTGEFALGRLFGYDLSISGTVSPIILQTKVVSFNAVNNGNTTRLRWLVNCTSSAVTFELQRGKSNSSFNTIYSKTETQSRCAAPFDLADNFTPEGNNFYRLKIIDIDGKISYSTTLLVTNKKNDHSSFNIFPNYVQDNATLVIQAAKESNAQLLFVNSLGVMVKKMAISLFTGTNNISINASSLLPGIYCIKIVMADGTNGNVVMVKQ